MMNSLSNLVFQGLRLPLLCCVDGGEFGDGVCKIGVERAGLKRTLIPVSAHISSEMGPFGESDVGSPRNSELQFWSKV